MSSEYLKSYLSNIEESLFDEKRIVTYSWLSKTFGIHCNVSKQLLYTFFENSPKKEELSVTYLLIGLPNDGNSRQVLIVRDKDLQEAEKNLKSITSKHIYSIQKCQELNDINVLYTPLTEESADCISKGVSAIDFDSKERDNVLIAKLRQDALPTAPAQPSVAKKANPPPANKPKSPDKSTKNEQGNKVTTNGDNGKESGSSKTENKNTVVPSMFSKAKGPKKKLNEKAAVNSKNPQGIGAFFLKTTTNKPSVNSEPKIVVENKELRKEETVELRKEETIQNTEPVVNVRVSPLKENKATLNICTETKDTNKKEESPKEVVKPKKGESKSKTSSKKAAPKKEGKKKPVKKGDSQQKKRKRLVVLSDSESNNSSENEEEVEREPTPEPQPTFNPEEEMDDDVIYGTPEPSKKRKKRKLVSRTFKDADGFMVTDKNYEDVSASEDEEPVPEKKFKESSSQDNNNGNNVEKLEPKNKSQKIKQPSPQKVKQSSLTSFFKKK